MSEYIDFEKLKASAYKGHVKLLGRKPSVSDEYLEKIFNTIKNLDYKPEVLKELIGGTITVTVPDPKQEGTPKRLPINQRTMDRLKNYTKENWKQVWGVNLEGERTIRFVTIGKYNPKQKQERKEKEKV